VKLAPVVVRRGDASDRAFVRELGRATAMSSVSAVREGRAAEVLVAFERLLTFAYNRDHVVLIGELAGKPAGFLLMVYDIPDEVTLTEQAFIAYTAVEPEARRSGVARALLEEAERQARAAGRGYLSLMVTEDNLAARALYDGAAFATERRMMTKLL
jgi:ribosomal protein S18 acetylase RimI-like enzyme